MARNKVRGTIEAWVGEKPMDLAATAAGVGLSGTIMGWVRHYAPLEGTSDEIVQALTGLGLINYGDRLHAQVPNVGRGVLLQLLGRIAAERLGPMIPAPGASSNNPGNNPGPNPNQVIDRRLDTALERLS